MPSRNRAYLRKQRARHINRKLHIARDVWKAQDWVDAPDFAPGTFAKGKIHCSCPLCAFSGTTMSDKRKLRQMENQLMEFWSESA